MITYSVLATFISNTLSNRYGINLNDKRIELGIKSLTQNWTLDSTILQSPVRGFNCFPSEILDTTDYGLLESKWYCQYWTNQKVDKTKPYHKSKKIYFTKSIWLWENTIDFEYDSFINPNSELLDYEELEVTTHWSSKEIYGHLAHIKNGEDLLIDDLLNDFDINKSMFGFTNKKVNQILEKWKLK